MAKKISQLPSTGTVDDADVVIVVDGGVTKQSTVAAFRPTATATTAGVVELATDAEAKAGTDDTRALTPAKAAVRDEKYDVRRSGVVLDGVTNNTTALNNALTIVGAAGGGIARIPGGGLCRIDSTFNVPDDYVEVTGDGEEVTKLMYRGNGTAVYVTGNWMSRVKNLSIINDTANGGTGTRGLHWYGDPSTVSGHWRCRAENIRIVGFSEWGLRVHQGEQFLADNVYVSGCGVGISLDSDVGEFSWNNEFHTCRSIDSTSYNWYVDKVNASRFIGCEALNSAAAAGFQFYVEYGEELRIEHLDIEDTTAAGTKHGLRLAGKRHVVSVESYGLSKAIDIVGAAEGCYIAPSKFTTVTTPLTIGASITKLVVFDGGNLGTVSNAAPLVEVHYLGDKDLTDLALRWIRASSTGAASLDFHEDTDNGSDFVRLTSPAALSGTRTVTLPDANTTLIGHNSTATLTNKTIGDALTHTGTTVGFNGATPVGKRTLGAAATDAATTQTLANNLRQALIDLGLGQT